MADRIHGKWGRVYLDLGGSPGSPAGGSPFAPTLAGDIKSFTLSMKTDRVEVTAMGDPNKRRVAGLPDYSGAVSWWFNSTGQILEVIAAILAGSPVGMRLIPDIREPNIYFEGAANLDGELSVDVNGATSFDGTWDAAGNWEMAS